MTDTLEVQTVQRYSSISDWLLRTGTPSGGRRSPPYWNPNGAFEIAPAASIGGAGFTQVLGQKPGRHTFVILNNGPNPAFLSNVQTPQVPGIAIAVGGQWSVDTEGEVYAMSVLGTVLTVVETYWPITLDYRTAGGMLPDFSALVP